MLPMPAGARRARESVAATVKIPTESLAVVAIARANVRTAGSVRDCASAHRGGWRRWNEVIQLDRVDEAFRAFVAVRRRELRDRAGRVLRDARSLRLRQDHDAAHDRRLRAADRRARSASRARTSRRCRRTSATSTPSSSSTRLFPHMSVYDNVAFGPRRPRRSAERRGRAAGRRDARGRPPHRLRQPQAEPALRWAAAARRARPGARELPERAPARRAARRARPEAAPGDAARAEAHPARGRHHVRVRHPRSGRGAHDERPDRGDERGPRRADRRAARRSTTSPRRCSSRASSATPTCCRSKCSNARATRRRSTVGGARLPVRAPHDDTQAGDAATLMVRPERVQRADGSRRRTAASVCRAP